MPDVYRQTKGHVVGLKPGKNRREDADVFNQLQEAGVILTADLFDRRPIEGFNMLPLLFIPQDHAVKRVIRLRLLKNPLKLIRVADVFKQVVSQVPAILADEREAAVFFGGGWQIGRDVVGGFQVAAVIRAELAQAVKRKIARGLSHETCLGVILDHNRSDVP